MVHMIWSIFHLLWVKGQQRVHQIQFHSGLHFQFETKKHKLSLMIISALIVFARFWRILRVINGVIVGTKQDGDTRVKHLKKKIAIMKNQEFDNGSLKISLDEVMEENVRLNLLQERLEEDDGRQGSMHQWFRFLILIRIRISYHQTVRGSVMEDYNLKLIVLRRKMIDWKMSFLDWLYNMPGWHKWRLMNPSRFIFHQSYQ